MEYNAEYFYERAFENFQRGDKDAGRVDLDKAIELAPRNAGYLLERALLSYHADDYLTPIEDFTRIIEMCDPINILFNCSKIDIYEIYGKRLVCYLHTSQHVETIQDLNWFIEQEPNNASRYQRRAETKLMLKDYAGSIEDCTIAYQLSPSSQILSLRASAYSQHGLYEEALTDLNEILASYDDYLPWMIYHKRGFVHYEMKNETQALQDFREVARLENFEPYSSAEAYIRVFLPAYFDQTETD